MLHKEIAARTSRSSTATLPDSDIDPGPLGLREVIVRSRRMGLRERTRFFTTWVQGMRRREDSLHLRPISSPTDRITLVGDHTTEGEHGANRWPR